RISGTEYRGRKSDACSRGKGPSPNVSRSGKSDGAILTGGVGVDQTFHAKATIAGGMPHGLRYRDRAAAARLGPGTCMNELREIVALGLPFLIAMGGLILGSGFFSACETA